MTIWVRALCALADWLSRGVWDVRGYLGDEHASEQTETWTAVGIMWNGWHPIRLL